MAISNERRLLRVAQPAMPVIGRATYGVRARGGIGRRGRFRSCCRKMWGFESLRAHQAAPAKPDIIGILET